jgi:tetratricopeptide (TPR) repeat protein
MTRYVVVDTETTGTVPHRDRVIWIAAAVLNEDTVTERWSTFLDPGPGSRLKAGGVGLAGQPTFADIEPRLTAMLRRGVLVAHNAPFDVSFLTAEYKRAGRAMPDVQAICTLRLAHRLELDVASLSLVDCCAHFGIVHQRRHRADEDVEATLQLLKQLLPLASMRGWSSVDALMEALAPVARDDGELVFTIEVNLEELLAKHLIEKAGWRPEEESAEDALTRYRRQLRAERDAAYARMDPDHRTAHEMKDALGSDERRASAWLPVLQALEAAKCPELAETWVEYGKRLQGPKRNATRALGALQRALELYFASPAVSRTTVDDAVAWVSVTCSEANLPDELIETYRAFGPRLAALPPCGECGNLAHGCLGGGACRRADLAASAAWAPFEVDFDSDESEDPAVVERRARAVLPVLALERDLTAYVRLGREFSQRLVAWGRSDDALALWGDVVVNCAGRDVPSLAEETDHFAEALAAAKRYVEASVIATSAVDTVRQQGRPEVFWRVADHLAAYLERTGRLEEAMSLWREAIDAGSDIPNTYDRLSLALERAGSLDAAATVCETGLSRFSRVVRRYKYAQQLERRAERCRAKIQEGGT